MVVIQAECFRLEEKSVLKFLVAEKSKPYETYKRMRDVCGEKLF